MSAQIPIQQLVLEKKQQQSQSIKSETSSNVNLVLTEKHRKGLKGVANVNQKQLLLHQMEKLSFQKQLERNPALQNHRAHVQETFDYKSFLKEKKYQKYIELANLKVRLVIDTVEGMYNFTQQLKEREKHSAYPTLTAGEKYNLRRLTDDIHEPFLSFLCENLNIRKEEVVSEEQFEQAATQLDPHGLYEDVDGSSTNMEPSVTTTNTSYYSGDDIDTVDGYIDDSSDTI